MSRRGKAWPLLIVLSLLVACDSFKKDEAALQIQERFCGEWPYGCTDSTRVVIENIEKTRHGRQVRFRVVDRKDRTAELAAAYFEPRDDEWQFLLFENPFDDMFKAEAARFEQDRKKFSQALRDLKAAQNWYMSIYSRYARDLQELDSVSYKPVDPPIRMTVASDAKSWKAELANPFVSCEFELPRQQLPVCVAVAATHAGSDSGPLSRAFGEEAYRQTRFGKE